MHVGTRLITFENVGIELANQVRIAIQETVYQWLSLVGSGGGLVSLGLGPPETLPDP